MGLVWIFILFSLITSLSSFSYGYDSLDPYGNITITWDFILQNSNNYDITVSVRNYQLFRHIERPGWKLSWAWKSDQVIWSMWGAEATEQGNCSNFRGGQLPHCCEKRPVIVDLLPGAPYNQQVANCCRGGILSPILQDPSMSVSSFRMIVGGLSSNSSDVSMPENFTLGIPGYTCGDPFNVSPTRFTQDHGRRYTQALATWNVNCIYSQFRASTAPNCCVSFSAFYNETIVPCPKCSCNCQGLPGAQCVKAGEIPSLLELPHSEEASPLVRCSQHMCPISIHWHVKQSYTQYWRVTITITNLNFVKNYSHWNLVVLHPNLKNITEVFSFNYDSLSQYGNINDTGMFWGIKSYNDMLLTSGKTGNVQTEMLLNKDPGIFTFREGWAFPRKISFNGDECVMPLPDEYPRLPNKGDTAIISPSLTFFSLILPLIMFT